MIAPHFTDPDVTLYCADALDALREMPDASVHMACTSPPFFGLRDYGTGTWEGGDEGCDHTPTSEAVLKMNLRLSKPACSRCGAVYGDPQIGLESSPAEWAARLVDVFREVRRVLRDDGTLWVECGDSYASSGGQGEEGSSDGFVGRGPRGRRAPRELKPKDLIGQPWLLARMLRDPYYTGQIKDERDRIWLAAMVEAEGCTYVHKRKAGESAYTEYERADGTRAEYQRTQDTYGPGVQVASTDRVLVERCQAIAGVGSISESHRGRNRPIFRWCVLSQQARDLLRELYPHLVAKGHEARLAYSCPTSGDVAAATHQALKDLHQGRPTTVDAKPPETLYEPGWYLRACICWAKSNAMPESVGDRPTSAHSYVFLLSKKPRYYYDAESLREPAEWARWGDQTVPKHGGTETASGWIPARSTHEFVQSRERRESQDGVKGFSSGTPNFTHAGGKNARSVWQIPTEPNALAICRTCNAFWQGGAPREHCGQPVVQHFAAFPRELVRRMILAGTSERGVCAECGAPWVRETIANYKKHRPSGGEKTRGERGEKVSPDTNRDSFSNNLLRRVSTIGWKPSCACPPSADELERVYELLTEIAISEGLISGESPDAVAGSIPASSMPAGGLLYASSETPPEKAVAGTSHVVGGGGYEPEDSAESEDEQGYRRTIPATILDPFAGSGTSLLVARQLGRHAIGIELNERYCAMVKARLAQLSLLAEAV